MPSVGLYAQTCEGLWISPNSSGNWSDGSNWNCVEGFFCPCPTCPSCIPGNGGAEDYATFGSTIPSGDVTITLDSGLPGGTAALNNFKILDNGFSYTFVQESTETLSFVAGDPNILTNMHIAGSHTLNVPTTFSGGNPFTLTFSDTSLLRVTQPWGAISPPSSMTVTGPGIFNPEGVAVTVNGPAYAYGGNHWMVSTTTTPLIGNGGSLSATDIWVREGGNITNMNNADILNDTNGSAIFASTITVDALENVGEYQHSNFGRVFQSVGYGTMTFVSSDTNIKNGFLQLENMGFIGGGSSSADAVGGSFWNNNGDFYMTAGAWSNINHGEVNGRNTFGTLIEILGKYEMTDGLVEHSNYGKIRYATGISGDITYGVGFKVQGDYWMYGGTTSYANYEEVESAQTSVGVIHLVEGDHTHNGGVFSLANYARVTGGGIGVAAEIVGHLTINDGLFSNSNGEESLATDFGSIGSLVKADSIEVNGGMFVNDDTVATDHFFVRPYGTMAGAGQYYDQHIGFTTNVVMQGMNIVGDPAPGGLPGIATINGTYSQTSTGTLAINVLNNSNVSKLIVTGPASISGELLVGASPGFDVTPGATYPILQANGGLSGTFGSVVSYNLPSYVALHVLYFPDLAEFVFSPNIVKYVRLQQPVFSSVNETNMRLQVQMGRQRGHFTKNTPIVSKPKQATKKTTGHLQEEVSIQFVSNSFDENIAASNVEKEKTQRLTETVSAPQELPWNFYIGPKGQIGNVLSKKDTQQGYSDWSAGFFTGIDYAWSQVGVGLLAEYERATANVGKHWGHFTIDNVHASLYSTYAPASAPEFSLQGIIGGGYDFYSIDRNIGNPENQKTKSSPGAGEFDAFFGLEYAIRKSNVSGMPKCLQIIPLASVQFMYLTIGEYKEKGADSFDMKIGSQHPKSLRTSLGFRVNENWNWTNVSFSPELTFAWQREFFDKGQTIDFTPIGQPQYGVSLKLPRVGRNIALAGVDLLLTLYKRHGIEAGYNFEYNSMYHTHFMYMSYNIRF